VKTLGSVIALLALMCGMTAAAQDTAARQVVFVCEHGNVKSLMAASYFNQLATQRGLPFRAVSRGAAPDSTTVPQPIVAGLRADGVDVSDFHPSKIATADLDDAVRVIAISTDLPPGVQVDAQRVERWSDVPAASVNYDAARTSLKAHVAALLERLAAQ
jgi:arsenate reductase (thioredoxin)